MNALKSFIESYSGNHVRTMFLFSILSNVLVLAPSFHMLQVYDRVLTTGSMATLFYLTVIILFALVVYGFAEIIRSRVAQRLAARYVVTNSERLYSNLVQLPATSAATKHLRNFSMLKSFLAGRTFSGLFDLPFIPLFLGLLFLLHWTIGLLTLIGIVAMVMVAVANSKATEQLRAAAAKMDGEATAFAQASFSHGEEIRSMGLLPNFILEWSTKGAAALKSDDELNEQSTFYYAVGKVLRLSLQVCIMAWGAYLVVAGNMSGGLIFLSSMISGKALGPIELLIGGWDGIMKAKSAFLELETFLGDNKELRERPRLPEPKGFLSCANIRVADRETGSSDLVAGVSVAVAPGELVVITGPSSSGKSLLAKVLAGAIEPTEGELRLDGAARDQWPAAQWGPAIGYAGQETIFFPGTIASNIARFSAPVVADNVYRAAIKAGVHEAILRLPKGYQTVIGMGTLMLPSSLTQGIALARALYGKPRCLILDQPSAHLDKAGEEQLCKTLAEAKAAGLAIVVVTRRSAVFALANRVVLLVDGRIVHNDPQRLSSASDAFQQPSAGREPAPRRAADAAAPRSIASAGQQ